MAAMESSHLPRQPNPLASHPVNFSRPNRSPVRQPPPPPSTYTSSNSSNSSNASQRNSVESEPAQAAPASPSKRDRSKSPSKLRANAQGSRFQEGSMNDRTSAVPPLSFIGEQERFEQRLKLDFPGELGDDYVLAPPAAPTSSMPPPPPSQQRPQPAAGFGLGPPQTSQSSSQQTVPLYERAAASMDTYPTQSALANSGIRRPVSAADSYGSGKRGFWGGLREKFSFSRDKALGSAAAGGSDGSNSRAGPDGVKRPISLDSKMAGPGAAAAAALKDMNLGGPGDKMPSREEILANYQELKRNGFFESHATQSTRHAHPGGLATQQQRQLQNPREQHGPQQPPPAVSTPARAPTGASFSDRMANEGPQHTPGGFRRKPPPQAHQNKRQQWPLPTIDSPAPSLGDGRPATAASTSSPSRGTKRTLAAEDEDMTADPGNGGHGGPEEGGSFKKLRKSASRISIDLNLPRLRKQRSHHHHQQQQQQPPLPQQPTEYQQHAAAMSAMPPPPTPNFFGIATRRSASSSSRRETNRLVKRNGPISKTDISAPVPIASGSAYASEESTPRMSIDSATPSFASDHSTATLEDRPTHKPKGRTASISSGIADAAMRWARPLSRQGKNASSSNLRRGGGSEMDVDDSPPSAAPGHGPNDRQPQGDAAPGYALRTRPNVNRSVPSIPRIADHFKDRFRGSGGPAHRAQGAENLFPSGAAGVSREAVDQSGGAMQVD